MTSYYHLPYHSPPLDTGQRRLDPEFTPSATRRRLRSLKPWSFRDKKADATSANGSLNAADSRSNGHLVAPLPPAYGTAPYQDPPPLPPRQSDRLEPNTGGVAEGSRRGSNGSSPDGDGTDEEVDAYSWVDPSIIGTARLRSTPTRKSSRSVPSSPRSSTSNIIAPASSGSSSSTSTKKAVRPGRLEPADSYNLLLAYQSSSSSHGHSSTPPIPPVISPPISTEGTSSRHPDPEWHDLVDPSMLHTLSRQEVQRQGLWWELIKGEMGFVKDLNTICADFIEPLRSANPPLLTPEKRLDGFIAEVFSSIPMILDAHEHLLRRLLERQRSEWPLMTSGTDLILRTFLDSVDLYEMYMKNYPFSEARIRREGDRNPAFKRYLSERQDEVTTGRRDVTVFLSRPVTRLPRLLLLLEALLKTTPIDHPDQDAIPTVHSILTSALKGSQPGIESAENKIKLWNIAEQLMFKKGEIIELDIGDPKRHLVHAGYVFRRIRSESNWHGWQDLHAFLLDNYFLLTRDIENGKHVIVSRPIHIDFLTMLSAEGPPERRHDYVPQLRRRHSGNMLENNFKPERLMYPFTISTTASAMAGKSYTLCLASEASRAQWKERLDGAKTMRTFDVESNRRFAVHTLSVPIDITDAITTAESFTWLGREAIAIATNRSVWIGWRRDSRSYRELLRFGGGVINALAMIQDFGQILVLSSGSLLAFDLKSMIPTHEPSTWVKTPRGHGIALTVGEQSAAFVRIGNTKGRLLVVYACHQKNGHHTQLTFHEPILDYSASLEGSVVFRKFASMTVAGAASEMSFFKQTIAVVTDKGHIIAEPGNSSYHTVPSLPSAVIQRTALAKMVSQAKPLAMYQIGENEFALVYNWGACYVNKYGEINRHGSFLRWNTIPTYTLYRAPHLLLYDENSGKIEVRDVTNGRMCEVVEEKDLRPVRLGRTDQGMLALAARGLIEVVETVEL